VSWRFVHGETPEGDAFLAECPHCRAAWYERADAKHLRPAGGGEIHLDILPVKRD
jgi:hypothetical protein